MPTPCGTCPKIPPGDPPYSWASQELSEENAQAYAHWKECVAVGHFPDDPLVKRDASLIRDITEAIERVRQSGRLDLLASMMRGRDRG